MERKPSWFFLFNGKVLKKVVGGVAIVLQIQKAYYEATNFWCCCYHLITTILKHVNGIRKKKYFNQIRWAMEKTLLYSEMLALVVLYDGDND